MPLLVRQAFDLRPEFSFDIRGRILEQKQFLSGLKLLVSYLKQK